MIFRVAETEPMPKLVVGYTELSCSKLKKSSGFLKPNFEPLPIPELLGCQVRRVRQVVWWFCGFLGLSRLVSACLVLCAD